MKPSALARLREIVRQEHRSPDGTLERPASADTARMPRDAAAVPETLDTDSRAQPGPSAAFAAPTAALLTVSSRLKTAAAVLGGAVVETSAGPCVVVERAYAPAHRHGVVRLGDCAELLHPAADPLTVLRAPHGPAHAASSAPLLFLDLETTGLTGGAGTVAFLVGCASFEGDTLCVRQIVMPEHRHERALLALLRERLGDGCGLVTYNGRTFDVPVLETRFSYHRQNTPFDGRPHLDMLPPARRLWRDARPLVAHPGAQTECCSLSTLERVLFGVRRRGDVGGFEIPTRYFTFIRSGDAGPLRPVLEHNRLDLISLAVVTARASALVARAPAEGRARECLGLARLFAKAGDDGRAQACCERVVELTDGSWHADEGWIRAEALRSLALGCRRAGRHEEAARRWQAITRIRTCPPALLREAWEALAIHCEHRARDIDGAYRYAEESGRVTTQASRYKIALDRRLARLERKRHTRGGPGPPLWG